MHWWASIFGIVLIFIILMDAFGTVVLPRRIKRSFRITGWFYRNSWGLWTRVGRHIKSANRREGFLAYFGPLSLIPLMGWTRSAWTRPMDILWPVLSRKPLNIGVAVS